MVDSRYGRHIISSSMSHHYALRAVLQLPCCLRQEPGMAKTILKTTTFKKVKTTNERLHVVLETLDHLSLFRPSLP